MKKSYFYCFYAIICIALLRCATPEKKPIVVPRDYQFVFENNSAVLVKNDEDLEFWRRRGEDEVSLVKVATLYADRFKLTGKVEDVLRSDSLYQTVLLKYGASPELLQAMAANSITQHQFKKAKEYILQALTNGDKKGASLLMLADIQLELGDPEGAAFSLEQLRNKNSFAFLIRQAKIKDQAGEQDTAIHLMEKAFERVKGNKALSSWTKTNLADRYGHAGRIAEAYQAYLDVLRQDPADDYALKGIAWIALSHDRNFAEAKKLLMHLIHKKDLPDYQLLLAELSEAAGNEIEKKEALEKFTAMTNSEAYERMYAKYKIMLEAEEFAYPDNAIAMAQKEIASRPSPQSYDLLAWSYFQKGDRQRAVDLCENHVEGKTLEPEACYHMGMIYAEKNPGKSKSLLTEALNSAFELGPSIEKEIKKALAQ